MKASSPRRLASWPRRTRLASPSGALRQRPVRSMGISGEGAGAADGAFELDGAGVGGAGVGAGGMAGEAEVPLAGGGKPEGEVGLGEGEGELLLAGEAGLEVDAGVGGFDVGEARRGAGLALGGGRGGDLGGLEEEALEVPAAVGVVDEVEAGRVEGDAGELDAATPERADAERGADAVGADDGLVAEAGILLDDEVLEGEAGQRQQVERDAIEMDGATERGADAGDDAALEAVDVDQRRNQREQKDGRAGADRRTGSGGKRDGVGDLCGARSRSGWLRWGA